MEPSWENQREEKCGGTLQATLAARSQLQGIKDYQVLERNFDINISYLFFNQTFISVSVVKIH